MRSMPRTQVQQRIRQSPTRSLSQRRIHFEEEMGTDAIWAIACLTAALGAQNDKNPLIELSADDFEGVEAAETIKGLYHLVD